VAQNATALGAKRSKLPRGTPIVLGVDPLHSRALRLEQHGEGSSWQRPQG